MQVYDSHCHLESINLDKKPELAIVPGVNLQDISKLVELRALHPEYKVGFGIHPWFINGDLTKTIDQLSEAIIKFQPDFIGEIGLDYLKPDEELQKKYFIEQLKLSHKFNLPVIIHCVKAYNDVLSILKTYANNLPYSGILHAFNANEIFAQQFTDLGLLLGIGSLVTQNSTILKKLDKICLSSIVLESDAPFMAAFGKNISSSDDTFLYAQIAAKKLDINLIDLINYSNNNLLHLFRN